MRLISPSSIAVVFCLTVSTGAMAFDKVQASSATAAGVDSVEPQTAGSGATDLKFHDFFKLPVGPRGLEPTQKLLALNGKRVRIVGYMAQQENPVAGVFILSPLPVAMGDEDDSLADDLPATAVFVHSGAGFDRVISHVDGLIKLSGILQLGSREETDGHVSSVRLMLDPEIAKALLDRGAERQAKR